MPKPPPMRPRGTGRCPAASSPLPVAVDADPKSRREAQRLEAALPGRPATPANPGRCAAGGARNGPPRAPQRDPPGAPAKSGFENLEDEMASCWAP